MKIRNSIRLIVFTLILLASLLAACSAGGKQPCLKAGEAFPTPAAGETYATFTIQNNTCMSICQILVSPDNCEYMGGVDWTADHPLRSQATVMQSIPAGKYAVWVELCSGEYRADEHIAVRADSEYAIQDDPAKGGAPPCSTSLTVINKTDVPVCNLWISNSGNIYDSHDWLGSEQILPGDSLNLALRSDTYDIKAEDCEGNNLRYEEGAVISGHQDWAIE